MSTGKVTATLVLGCIAFITAGAVFYELGSRLSAPANRSVGPPPADLSVVDVDSNGIKGWYVPAANTRRCVVLMHGVRSDRRSMIERSRFLRDAGYASLLFDFQAHGENPGKRITFGYLESENARQAVQLLRSKFNCNQVGAIGQSLGGAAALLGSEPLNVDALILESVYPTIEEAIADRLSIRLGGVGPVLTPLLTMQLKARIGVAALALHPIDRIGAFRHPIFVLAGTADRHTPLNESHRLFSAANFPKEFFAVEGAAHVDLHDYSPQLYQQRILEFLGRYLTR